MKKLFAKKEEKRPIHTINTQPEGMFKGQSPKKVVFIKVNPKRYEQQEEDMAMIERMSSNILESETHDEVILHMGIAVGYANAMKFHGIIDEAETSSLVDMLGTIGEDKLHEVDKINLNIIMHRLRKKVTK